VEDTVDFEILFLVINPTSYFLSCFVKRYVTT